MSRRKVPWRVRPDSLLSESRLLTNASTHHRQPSVPKRCINEKTQNKQKHGHSNKDRQLSHFSFKSMESLLDKPLEEIIHKLIENEHFFNYIGTKLSFDSIVLIARLLSRFCDCVFSSLRLKILQKSLSSGYVVNLQYYVSNIAVQTEKDKRLNSCYWNDPDSFWNNLIRFCNISLKEIPHFFVDNLLNFVKVVLINIPHIEAEHHVHISDAIKENFKSAITRAEEIIKVSASKKKPEKKENLSDEDQPPEDFRIMDIFPTTAELVGPEKPFLRKNVVIGPYEDVNHYLDIQFRLLREDFVGPLRLGIQGYLSGKTARDIQDIIIHPKVQFLHPVTVSEAYCVLLKFHFGGKLSNFTYEDSKKFMFGSLVCFSLDNFNSILFGRIVDRTSEYLKKGQLVIGFNYSQDIKYNTDYVMVECSVYFEPYYHVLKVLKLIQEDDFPMKNYILDVDKTVLNPNYGGSTVQYRIRNNNDIQSCYIFDSSSRYTFVDLNQSQNDAFIAALTRKFTIIQGPPGTGKTYVGLKVAKTLLHNSSVWFKDTPMLIICFTNHALDQFLEGLINTTDRIVRVGGQSKNVKLNSFNLKTHARRTDNSVWKAKKSVSEILLDIGSITYELNEIARYNGILSLKCFADIIPNYHQSWFAKASDEDFLEWLLNDRVFTDVAENENHISLPEQFENMTMGSSEESDENEEINEHDGLQELLMNMKTNVRFQILNLNCLKNNIDTIRIRLDILDSEKNEDFHIFFEYMTLTKRHERLEAIYEFVKKRLEKASQKMTVISPNIDTKESRYISIHKRWNLYFYWLHLYKESLLEKHRCYNMQYRTAFNVYNELKQMEDVKILKSMKVIGMTTTSAARLHSSLQLLRSPIVIVEEAAEVLEAHIVSALTKNCQQLILIGDHQQLRPSTANYKIEKHYKLGISLFERMIMNDVQCFTLDIQHRMRPQISSLIKPAIYPNLKDHKSVFNRPLINGVEKCLYFIDHKFFEESNSRTSKKNIHEAKFLVHLARYLILNGYDSHQITILAAYLGQMFEIQKRKKNIGVLRDVRVSVLDNFQGEESDIILLSLVRNNENTIGFLSIENRVCVALSRAKNGLYIMGNMSLLCEKSELWVKIRETLVNQEAIGTALCLKCQNHGKTTMVSTAENFSLVSEGGCDQICDSSLVCGHRCKIMCHSLDRDHSSYICPEICNRLLCDDSRHKCKKICGDKCGPCDYPKNVTLDCDHNAVIPCHKDPADYKCPITLNVTLPCGHDAVKPCHIETTQYKCKVPCDARLDCGHACLLNCHVLEDPDHIKYDCPKPCAKFRIGCTNLEDENHKCPNLCHQACEVCTKNVPKPRTVCPHYYTVPCNQDVDEIECKKPCTKILDCGHKCKGICGTTCLTCIVKVQKRIPGCNHVVKLPCSVEADKIYCNKKCPRVLKCGHICVGLCKDDCALVICKQKVEVTIPGKCGHILKEVPCFVKTLYYDEGESSVEALESYCTEPCTAMLNCSPKNKHPCSGSCGTCNQGRIHKRCAHKCSRILICDHKCNGLCPEACKPCNMQCSNKCKHSVCKKRCSDLCIKCKEKCGRRCEHQQCRKMCGEICDVPPCEKPCRKTLACGHPCIGFCSDPCPQLCRICHKTEVEEFFFGTEDEEDARFILLNDCGHVLESTGMKQWLEGDTTKKIGFKVCPKCKTNIFTTERYSDYVKKAIKNISLAKISQQGTKEQINGKRIELHSNIQRLRLQLKSIRLTNLESYIKILLDRLQEVNQKEKKQSFNLIELNAMEIKYQLIKQVGDMMKLPDMQYLTISLTPTIKNQIHLILDNLFRDVDDITTTQIEDIQKEIKRLNRMIQIIPILQKRDFQDQSIVTEIINVNNRINKLSQYDEADDNIVKNQIDDLRNKMSILGVSESEKQEIVKAMGLSKGHWYMCPNGHPYAIGECGGAMETSVCPQCKRSIGGQNHRLIENNRVATFMDGATYSAWSEYQNINNFQL